MLKQSLFLIAACLGLAACNSASTSPKAEVQPKVFALDTSLVTILTHEQAKNWLENDVQPIELSETELEKADQILQQCRQTYNTSPDTSMGGQPLQALENYYRQYVPFVDINGQRKIWVNCFCTANPNDVWRNRIVSVMDGGSCYFDVIINLSTGKYENLSVNGEA